MGFARFNHQQSIEAKRNATTSWQGITSCQQIFVNWHDRQPAFFTRHIIFIKPQTQRLSISQLIIRVGDFKTVDIQLIASSYPNLP
jgi:hypothetical protein